MDVSVSVPSAINPKQRKVVFTAEQEELIFEHYQQHEFLWNPKHENYKFGWKRSAVQELAVLLGNKFTTSEIHARFSGMRKTYRQNVNKVKSSTTGSATGDIYVPTWQHYDSLKFLDAAEPTRKATTSYTVQEKECDTYTDVEFIEECTNVPSNVSRTQTPKSAKSSKSGKSTVVNTDDVMDECLGILRTVARSEDKENVEHLKKPIDRCQHFSDYVASSLREMTPWYQSCAIAEMTNVLLKYDQNNPDTGN